MQGNEIKWKTLIGLCLMSVAIIMDWSWAFGVLFIIWALNDVYWGRTYFLEEVNKEQNPWLFWLLVITWAALGAYSLFA